MAPPIVKRYLLALNRYKWAIPTGAILGIVGAGVVVVQPEKAPSYSALGILAYNRPPISFSATGTQIQTQGQDLTEDVLLADNVLQAAASETNNDPRAIVKQVKLNIPKRAAPTAPPPSPYIQVQYTDSDQRRAVETVNALMKAMQERSRAINGDRVKAIIDSINARLPQVKQELSVAEQNLEQFNKREAPAILAAQDGSLIKAITASQAQQRQTQLTLQGVDAQVRSLERKLGLTPEQAYVSSALSADPIIANLRTQIYQTESQLTLLSRDLRPEHPTMVKLLAQKQSYEKLLQQRAAEVVGGNGVTAPLANTLQIRQDSSLDPTRQQLANTMGALQTQREALQQQLLGLSQSEQNLRREYSNIPNKRLIQAQLEQQVTLKKALHDQMQAKLVDARAAEAETVTSLSIAKTAGLLPLQAAGKMNPFLMLGLGLLVGVAVGGGLVFLLDMLEGRFYTLEDLREALRQRDVAVLGVLPFVWVSDEAHHELPVLVEPNSPYLEFYERFRSNLRRLEGNTLKLVLLTSTIAKEGKSTCAYNLAIASARAGKRTLLFEADLRSPSDGRSLKVVPDPDSTIEPLRYYNQLNDCIRLVPDVENLYILPSPGPQRQAAAILESSEIRRILEDVRGRFDMVVIDTPSLSLCNDALILEPYTDGMILVTRPGYTQDSLLGEAVNQLTESEDINLIGAVINGTDVQPAEVPSEPDLQPTLEAKSVEEFDPEATREEVATGRRDL